MQSVAFNSSSKGGNHRQRIAESRENNFIAGWSRSTQHATIRYGYRCCVNRDDLHWNTYFSYRIGSKHDTLTTIVAWHIQRKHTRLPAHSSGRGMKAVNGAGWLILSLDGFKPLSFLRIKKVSLGSVLANFSLIFSSLNRRCQYV